MPRSVGHMATTGNARQAPGRLRRVLGMVIVSFAVLLVAVAFSSPRATRESAAPPGEVIDRFLSAAIAHDVDAASAVFESDATISDSGGRASRGSDVARRFIEEYAGYEAGPRE